MWTACKSLVAALFLLLLTSCSENGGTDEERTAREEKQQEIATEIVDRIRDPIDRAKAVQEREEARRDSIEEQAR